jgi:hypothetical protein
MSMALHPNAAAVRQAITQGDLNRVKSSLCIGGHFEAELALTAIDETGMGALHFAAANGSFSIVEWCCGLGIDLEVGVPGSGWTAAHFAAYNGYDRICAMLKHSNANTDKPDNYGDTPCDVATATDHHAVVDVLGGNAAIREARQRVEEERARLLQEAREFEEERQRQQRLAKEDGERKKAAETRRQERIRRAKELRATLELARLEQIQKWLQSREGFERDLWNNLEWLFASQLLIAGDLIAAEIRCAAIFAQSQESAEMAANAAAADGKAHKPKRRNSKMPKAKKPESKPAATKAEDGRATASPSLASASASANPDPVAATAEPPPGEDLWQTFEHRLADDPELQLPVITGVITKEKKKELAKLRNKIEKIKAERRNAYRQAIDAHDEKCAAELAALEAEESLMRKLVAVDWLVCMAKIEQADAFNDRRHKGEYVYHSEDPRCECGLPSCPLGTCTWSCCGDAQFDTVGCAIVDDRSKPPYHPGAFRFHMDGCTCAQKTKVAVGKARDAVKTLVSLRRNSTNLLSSSSFARDSSDDDHGSGESVNTSLALHASDVIDATIRNRRGADDDDGRLEALRFCNPGGTVWSCCGALDADSDGCMMWPRYLPVENVLAWPSFELATDFARTRLTATAARKAAKESAAMAGGSAASLDTTLAKYCRVGVMGDRRMRVDHALSAPLDTTSTRCTVLGVLSNNHDVPAIRHNGPLDTRLVMCFELQVLRCPKSRSHGDEKMVVGFAKADAFIGPGVCIGGDNGIGWWAQSCEIRGLGYSIPTSEAFDENDVVCLALDHLNGQLYAFKNRRLLACAPFRAPARLVPAVTLVAGTRVRCDETMSRTTVAYVDEYISLRAETDLHQRLYGSSERYRSLFRDKFEISAKQNAGESSDDEGRINFDV